MTIEQATIWSAWASVITAVATLLFLLAGLYSAKQFLDQMRLNSYQNIAAHMLELDRFLFDHPSVRPYLYGGQSLQDDADPLLKAQVESMAEYYTDFVDNLLAQRHYMRIAYWEGWERYMKDTYESSPALRDFLVKHGDWYTKELTDLVLGGRSDTVKDSPRTAADRALAAQP